VAGVTGDNHNNKETVDKIIYQRLNAITYTLVLSERQNHTLPSTDLVHETFAKLSSCDSAFPVQIHYFRALARKMCQMMFD